MDIVVNQDGERIGFLAETVQEYAIAMTRVMKMPREKRLHMAQLARRRAMAFSVEHFDKSFKSAMSPILDQIRSNQKFCHNHR
jgi:alpha-1,2-mannosyltransferase